MFFEWIHLSVEFLWFVQFFPVVSINLCFGSNSCLLVGFIHWLLDLFFHLWALPVSGHSVLPPWFLIFPKQHFICYLSASTFSSSPKRVESHLKTVSEWSLPELNPPLFLLLFRTKPTAHPGTHLASPEPVHTHTFLPLSSKDPLSPPWQRAQFPHPFSKLFYTLLQITCPPLWPPVTFIVYVLLFSWPLIQCDPGFTSLCLQVTSTLNSNVSDGLYCCQSLHSTGLQVLSSVKLN